MCACAGSSTERFGARVPGVDRQVRYSCCRMVPRHERTIFSNIRRQGPDGPQLGRIGFMSTQRREENRRRRTMHTVSVVPPVWFHPSEHDWSLGPSEREVEESLRSDHRTSQFIWPARQETRRGLPPPWAGSRTANSRSFHPASPSPAEFLRLHPPLPQIPAHSDCWVERYDGKRDLYFQHAA